ncbi:hypothetical protein [Streptomyces ipomoeae]|uniref:hypothetical protein n=1 Tax=Streptomyces ipomoeae TaxID=103232 RepID=UPI0015F0DFDA|nr:hypothetical protein [Streptomyces ipomoeae]
MADQIQSGQVYVACDPREEGRRIRITAYTPGHTHADIVDADSGRRPRPIQVRSLHQSATVRGGASRRTGYVLETSG